MAILICSICTKLIRDNDTIATIIKAKYKPLKSTVNHALDKQTMEVIGPVYHHTCYENKEEAERHL